MTKEAMLVWCSLCIGERMTLVMANTAALVCMQKVPGSDTGIPIRTKKIHVCNPGEPLPSCVDNTNLDGPISGYYLKKCHQSFVYH